MSRAAAEQRRKELNKHIEAYLATGGTIRNLDEERAVACAAKGKVNSHSLEEEVEEKAEEPAERLEDLWDQT